MRGLAISVVGASLWFAAAANAQPIMTSSDLTGSLEAFDSYRPKDSFSPSFDLRPFLGRKFRLVLQVAQPGTPAARNSGALWTYNPDTETLRLSALGSSWLPKIWTSGGKLEVNQGYDLLSGVALRNSEDAGSGYVGQTAFGARAGVKVTRRKTYGLVILGQASGEPYGPFAGYEISLQLPPDRARQITPKLRLVLEGELTEGPHGVAACGFSRDRPTLDDPKDTTRNFCLFFTRLSRAAFESADGAVVASWTRSAAQ